MTPAQRYEQNRRARRAAERAAREMEYVPLEDILSRPRVRVLRAMRRMDWSVIADILDAAGIPDRSYGEPISVTAASHVTHMVHRGEAERRGRRGAYEYRITAKGRAALDEVLRDYERTLEAA